MNIGDVNEPGYVYMAGLLEMAFDAAVVFDSRERITYWNPAAEQMYGWIAQETLGKTPAKLFWPASTPEERKNRKQRQSRLKRGETLRGEHVTCRKDGSALHVQYATRAVFDAEGKFSGYLAVYHDISAQVQAPGKTGESEQRVASPKVEAIGRESGRKFSILFDKVSVAAALSKPPTGVIMDVNEAWVKLFGYTRQEVIGKTTLELNINPDSAGRARLLAQLQERGSGRDIEINLRTKSGEWRNFLTNVDLVEIAGQKYILNTVQDITERKRAEEQLERSNQKLNEILTSIQDDFYVIDHDWMFVYANRQFASKLGKEPEDFVGNNVWKMFPKHVGTALGENFRAAMEKRETRRFEMRGKYTDAWYKITVFPSPEGITVLGSEITEHKRLQAETESMAKFPQENPNPVLRVSREGVVLFGNQASQKLLDHWSCSIGTPLPAMWREKVTERFRLGVPGEAILEFNGRIFLLQFVPIIENHYLNIYGRDITARRRAEEALRESEERYRHLVKHAPTGIYEIDIKTMRFIEVNDSMCQILGYRREELLSMMPEEFLDEEGRKQFRKRMSRALTGETIPKETEYRVRARDGRELWSILNVTINYEDGKPRSVSAIAHDITERKRAEAQLERSNQKLNEILTSIQDDFYVLDRDWIFVFASRSFTSKVGKEPEDFVGHNIWKMFPKYLGTAFEESFRAAMEKREIRRFEMRGKYTSAWYRMTVFPSAEGITVLGTDITKRRQVEEALRRSEARLRQMIKTSPLAISFGDSTGRIFEGNESFYQLTGYSREEIQSLHLGWDQLTAPEYAELDRQMMAALAATGSAGPYEKEYIRKDGSRVPLLLSVSKLPRRDEHVAFIMDMSERKRGEEQLRELSQRLTYHVDNSPLAVIEWGSDMRLIRWSAAAERMFGWKAEEVLGRRMEDLQWIYEEDRPQVNDVSVDLRTGINPQRFSANRNYRKDGSVAYCEWYNSSLLDESGNLRSILSLVLDVTERKHAEEALREHQKQLQLLNETLEQKVHEKTEEVRHLASDVVQAVQHERHRISHILHDDLQQRIYAIQMQLTFLHDELQRESEAARKEISNVEQQLTEILEVTRHLSIDLSPPILRDEGLSQAINWLAAQMRKQYDLPIELQAHGPFAIPDEALHVLLFNCVRELLFNVVKHAQASRAVVMLQWVEAGLQIEVRDDGKGFPVNMPEQQANGEMNEEADLQLGFGLSTIRHQLNLFGGRMEIQSEPGTGARVLLIVPIGG